MQLWLRALWLALCCLVNAVGGSSSVLLFLDDTHLATTTNLRLEIGSPKLLSEYHDSSSYIGWVGA